MDPPNPSYFGQRPGIPTPVHVHQWWCSCPYPHINPYRSPVCMPCYKPNVMVPGNHGYGQCAHGDPRTNNDMLHSQLYPHNFQMHNHMDAAGRCEEPAREVLTLQNKDNFTAPDIDTSNNTSFTKFLEHGCNVAVRIVNRHQHRAGFKKLQRLCQRMKVDLTRPSETEINIHSQGVPWVTKDFICAYMRLISCWSGLKGYLLLKEGSLGSIELEINDSFRSCFALWEDNTKNLSEHFVRIFTNLDQNISNRHLFNRNQMIRVMPSREVMSFLPIEGPLYAESTAIAVYSKPKNRKKRRQNSDAVDAFAPIKGIQIEFYDTARNVDVHFQNLEKDRILELERREKRKELLANNNRLHEQKFNQFVEQSFQAASREVRVYRRVEQTSDLTSGSRKTDAIYELEIVSSDQDPPHLLHLESLSKAEDVEHANNICDCTHELKIEIASGYLPTKETKREMESSMDIQNLNTSKDLDVDMNSNKNEGLNKEICMLKDINKDLPELFMDMNYEINVGNDKDLSTLPPMPKGELAEYTSISDDSDSEYNLETASSFMSVRKNEECNTDMQNLIISNDRDLVMVEDMDKNKSKDIDNAVDKDIDIDMGIDMGMDMYIELDMENSLSKNMDKDMDENEDIDQTIDEDLDDDPDQGMNQDMIQDIDQTVDHNLKQDLNQDLDYVMDEDLNKDLDKDLGKDLHLDIDLKMELEIGHAMHLNIDKIMGQEHHPANNKAIVKDLFFQADEEKSIEKLEEHEMVKSSDSAVSLVSQSLDNLNDKDIALSPIEMFEELVPNLGDNVSEVERRYEFDQTAPIYENCSAILCVLWTLLLCWFMYHLLEYFKSVETDISGETENTHEEINISRNFNCKTLD